jgi:biopolymer transport protein ExbD
MHLDDEYLTTDELEVTRPRGKVDDEMDLTPMVDVTFLLLIFFMITAAFAVQKAISVPPVTDSAAASQTLDQLEQDSIVIRIDADNIYWVSAPSWSEEKQAVSPAEMRSKLREARGGGRGPSKLLVQAHGSSRHETVVSALDAGSDGGLEEIRLLSYEDGELGF